MQRWGKPEIPEKFYRPVASSGTIPTCEIPGVIQPGMQNILKRASRESARVPLCSAPVDLAKRTHAHKLVVAGKRNSQVEDTSPLEGYFAGSFSRAKSVGRLVKRASWDAYKPKCKKDPKTKDRESSPARVHLLAQRWRGEAKGYSPGEKQGVGRQESQAIAENRNARISRNALDADTMRRNLLHPDWLQLIATHRISTHHCIVELALRRTA
ncbi:hypothetical protein PR048_005918 [Dryococelus australis]|uniref:Uncharacterized protein n=1 Tax=Dryococelus australis TaxID=614101 RepID=A0ABQ9I9H9_9NEOP|nr:hypothetical protein PR048_005918 [Dryococelus australis]